MTLNKFTSRTLRLVQGLSISTYALTALGLIFYTIGCAVGLADWLVLSLTLGKTVYADAGMWLQIGITFAFATLVFMIPTNKRIMSPEQSHRSFQISMDDVAQAYYLCHIRLRIEATTSERNLAEVCSGKHPSNIKFPDHSTGS